MLQKSGTFLQKCAKIDCPFCTVQDPLDWHGAVGMNVFCLLLASVTICSMDYWLYMYFSQGNLKTQSLLLRVLPCLNKGLKE